MPAEPTTLKIQRGFAVFMYSTSCYSDGSGSYHTEKNYINLKSIIGFKTVKGVLLIDVKGHYSNTRDIYDGEFKSCQSSYINVGRVTSDIVDTLCDALSPSSTVDLLDMTG